MTQAPLQTEASYTSDAPTIYACLFAKNLPAGTVVEASWTYNNTSLDAFSTRLALPDAASQRWIAFHITRDPNVLWPTGTYALAVTIDGKTIKQASVEVVPTA